MMAKQETVYLNANKILQMKNCSVFGLYVEDSFYHYFFEKGLLRYRGASG